MKLLRWILLLCAVTAFAGSFAGKDEMNDIKYKDYEGFERKWQLITVRYRDDSHEQRFVWANEKAVKALKAGTTDYPDGSVFAKIGFITEEDPAFVSSRVPSGAMRYQFMVRNKEKYASTNGWGYALFAGNKKTMEIDPKAQTAACNACHNLVPQRGYVFSQPLKIIATDFKQPFNTKTPELNAIKFADAKTSSLPDVLRRNLPSFKSVRLVTGEIRNHVFRGTIDEIRPTLILESMKHQRPAVLLSKDERQFAVIYPDKNHCKDGHSLKSVFSTEVPNPAKGALPSFAIVWQDLCI